jgi:uncharacterized CHY-type Zn-finger protein
MVEKLKKANVPDSERNLLACNSCKLILTNRNWNSIRKCPNCNGPNDSISDFKGMISLMMPT